MMERDHMAQDDPKPQGVGVYTPDPAPDVPKSTELPVTLRREFGAIAEQIRKRIPFHERDYIACRDKLMNALEKCNHPRNIAMLTRVIAMLERMNQVDQHHVERMQHEAGILDLRHRRADEGKPSEIIGIQIAPAVELPLPESLRGYERRILEPGKN